MTAPVAKYQLPGSPAHAGIDRHEAAGREKHYRFPRTRGDRPQFAVW